MTQRGLPSIHCLLPATIIVSQPSLITCLNKCFCSQSGSPGPAQPELLLRLLGYQNFSLFFRGYSTVFFASRGSSSRHSPLIPPKCHVFVSSHPHMDSCLLVCDAGGTPSYHCRRSFVPLRSAITNEPRISLSFCPSSRRLEFVLSQFSCSFVFSKAKAQFPFPTQFEVL
jgi:hypothetical protein